MNERYEITVKGALPERWSAWLESVDLVYVPEQQQTVIHIQVADQTALHGVLNRIRDLGLHLVSVQQIKATGGKGSES